MYKEDMLAARKNREMLLLETANYVEMLRESALSKRDEYVKNKSNEQLRMELKNMLGEPVISYERTKVNGELEFVATDEYSHIYRVYGECMENVHSYGLLFLPVNKEKSDLVIAIHGKEGTAEIASSFYDSCNYNDMVLRVRKRGVAVYVPQLLLWNEMYGQRPDNEKIDVDLKQLGGSIASFEVYKIMKTIDFLVDNKGFTGKITAVGMSYGGFYSLLLTALDMRVTAVMSSCFCNDRLVFNFSDWTWFNSGNTMVDSELCKLIYPRKLYIALGENDPLFKVEMAEATLKKVREYYGNSENFQVEIFNGDHEFTKNDKGIDFVLNGETYV